MGWGGVGGDKLGEKEGKTLKKETETRSVRVARRRASLSFAIVEKNTTVVLFEFF